MAATWFRASFTALIGSMGMVALPGIPASAQSAAESYISKLDSMGSYLTGDKHNHTVCTDGSTSVEVLVNESIYTYGLDWFAQSGHGGAWPRDCRFSDPEYDGPNSGQGLFWEQTVGVEGIKGDEETTKKYGAGAFKEGGVREMWRWQMLNEFAYRLQRDAGKYANKPVWLGIETNAPGHEHVSMAIVQGQLGAASNQSTYATGQFEYLFDARDDDTSGGDGFELPESNGVPKTLDNDGDAGHTKAVASVTWLRDNFGRDAYYIPAHVERQGAFDPGGRRGWNVEHLRDIYTAGLLNPNQPTGASIAFGAEMLAGHQFANGGRGTYEFDRPSAGFGTYGGAGAYSAAEITVPGKNFDGSDLSQDDLLEIRAEFDALFEGRLTEPSGADQYDSLRTDLPKVRYVQGRPGLATLWDALLGEGRKFFNFGSSDWHNRGVFGPFEPQSTLDAWPGEYSKIYAYAFADNDGTFGFDPRTARQIIQGMRKGNSFSVHGDLIDSFTFVLCQGTRCATMGQTLKVSESKGDLTWMIRLRDPEGTNHSPYIFDNMSLAQLGQSVPTNEPVLSHVDVIRGDITGLIAPSDEAYKTAVSNPTVELFARIDNLGGDFATDGEFLFASGTVDIDRISNDMYFRVRGTNMPVGTPNETDADGNPVLDDFSALVECTAVDPAPSGTFKPEFCPEHLPVDATGAKFLDADVEAWTDLWFYANPIFVDYRG